MRRALITLPDRQGWQRLLIEAGWSVPLCLMLVYAGGLARFGWTDDPALLLRLAAVAIVAPALGEELLFRAALLPPPQADAPRWRYMLPVLLFIAWHPPQALLFGPHWAQVVLNPFFLAAVAVLGTALTRLYLATRSIWPPVALHWATIIGWKAFFGAPSPWLVG